MARFCIATKVQPSEYRNLTVREFGAFIEALNDRSPSIEELF